MAITGVNFAVSAYDWLLKQLFDQRLQWLDAIERDRLARAAKKGNVFKTAWLATFYHAERKQLAEHRQSLLRVGDSLSRWADRTTVRIRTG